MVQIQDFRKITDPFTGILQSIPQLDEENLGKKVSTCNPVGLGINTRISTADYVYA